MTINIPNLKEIYSRNIVDVSTAYNIDPDPANHIDPSRKNNPEGAFVYASSQQADGLYKTLDEVKKQLFLDTAEGVYLDRLAGIIGITRNLATNSNGFITIIGTLTTTIPAFTSLSKSDGLLYETKATQEITALSFDVSSMIRSATNVIVDTTSPHGLSPGMNVNISGANETDYNGIWQVSSVASDTQFSFTIATTPSSPATGTILAGYNGVFVEIDSIDSGANTNISAGGQLTISTPITGADNITYVQYTEIGGGTDEETDESFRARAIFKSQNPATPFSKIAIEIQAKLISGTTRVWVKEITPTEGQVTIYFVRDEDESIIPTAGEIIIVKDKILEIKPANTSDDDVIVSAPTPVDIPITFSSLSPSTSDMQDEIRNSLQLFFTSQTNEGQNIKLTEINNAIFLTIDNAGNQPIFTLTAPAGDTTINAGELGILGTITF